MSDELWVQESYINQTEGYRFGDSDWYETFATDRGQLFRFMQKEYGRCVSRMYVDALEGPPLQVGWVFEKVMEYEDSPQKYVREVWVQVSTTPVHKTVSFDAVSPWEVSA